MYIENNFKDFTFVAMDTVRINNNMLLSRSTNILANQIGKETVMMSIEEGNYYGMNKTGSYIWEILETPMTLSALCDRLVTDFNIPAAQCFEEVKPFIEEMVKEHILLVQ